MHPLDADFVALALGALVAVTGSLTKRWHFAVQANQSLTRVDLDSNQIGEKGAASIAEALKV